jgi:hypothetical protein
MRALVWEAPTKVGVHTVPDPTILSGRDAIVKVTSTAICGSGLHLYDGYVPSVEPGDVLGHEFMGEVVEVGSDVHHLAVGDRVVVPFPIACGACRPCQRGLTSLCENSNPNAGFAEKLLGHSPAGIFGYSHMLGGYQGGQAEYVRVPFADVGPMKIEDDLTDEQLLFLTDVLPTGFYGADVCDISPGDVVAVWGAGPVGQFAAASVYPARSRESLRHRPGSRAARDGRGEQRRPRHQLRGDLSPQGAARAHRRPRPRPRDRRRRHGGAHRRYAAARLRQGQAADQAGDRTPSRAARGDPVGRERRDGVDHGGLRRDDWTSSRSGR